MSATQTRSSPVIHGAGSWSPSSLTELRIHHRAARLTRVFGLDHHGRDDIRQQLFLRAVQAADRYLPDRGATLDHFIRLHLDFEYRTLRSELLAERAFGQVPEDGPGPCLPGIDPDHRPSCDLRLDLEAAEDRLPAELRAVAAKLRILTPAQIAAERGVHRGTVYREVALLRGVLEEFFAEDDIPRDTLGPGAERYGETDALRQPSGGSMSARGSISRSVTNPLREGGRP